MPKPNDGVLSWDEGKQLLAACAGKRARDVRDRAIVVLGLRTGMLRSSMCELTIKDLKLGLDGDSGYTLTFTKKGGDRHTIKLDPDTLRVLAEWIECLKSQGITSGRLFRSISKGDQATGSRLTPDGLYRAIGARAEIAKLEMTGYMFHRTFAAWARRARANDEQIAQVTGTGVELLESKTSKPPANFVIGRLLRRERFRR